MPLLSGDIELRVTRRPVLSRATLESAAGEDGDFGIDELEVPRMRGVAGDLALRGDAGDSNPLKEKLNGEFSAGCRSRD